jgi:hypothetical protein
LYTGLTVLIKQSLSISLNILIVSIFFQQQLETSEETVGTNQEEATQAPTQPEEVPAGSEEMVVAGLQVVSNGEESGNQISNENVDQDTATTEKNVDEGVVSEASSEASVQVPEENAGEGATNEENVDAGVESEASSEASVQVPEENDGEATTPATVEESAEQVTGATAVESDRIEGPVVTTKKSEGDSDNQVRKWKTERLTERQTDRQTERQRGRQTD